MRIAVAATRVFASLLVAATSLAFDLPAAASQQPLSELMLAEAARRNALMTLRSRVDELVQQRHATSTARRLEQRHIQEVEDGLVVAQVRLKREVKRLLAAGEITPAQAAAKIATPEILAVESPTATRGRSGRVDVSTGLNLTNPKDVNLLAARLAQVADVREAAAARIAAATPRPPRGPAVASPDVSPFWLIVFAGIFLALNNADSTPQPARRTTWQSCQERYERWTGKECVFDHRPFCDEQVMADFLNGCRLHNWQLPH